MKPYRTAQQNKQEARRGRQLLRRAEGEMVCVAVAPNEAISGMWQETLRSTGIHSYVLKSNLSSILRVYPASSSVEVYVAASQRKAAREILAPFEKPLLANKPGFGSTKANWAILFLSDPTFALPVWLIMAAHRLGKKAFRLAKTKACRYNNRRHM